MDCVLLAGGSLEPSDPLYDFSSGKPKALIPFQATTMLETILVALKLATEIERIVVVGIDRHACDLSRYSTDQIPDQGNIVDNVSAGVQLLLRETNKEKHALICTADIPLLTGEIIDRFITRCSPLESAVYYGMVAKRVMEERFPNSNRTYSRLSGQDFTGGNLMVARLGLVKSDQELLRSIVDARKHAWKIARAVGLSTMLKFLVRRLTLEDIESKATTIIGASAKVIISGDPEIAMDVDKPIHLALIEASVQTF